jgi:hypothetical protein
MVIANDIGREGWLKLRVMHRTMRKLWIGCFILTAVVFLLQVPPIPGVFLMFLFAPYWSVVTINLGFALMVLDGLVGSLPKLLLGFPAIWFVGYAAAAGVSHFDAQKLAAEVLSENSGHFLPFDAQRDQLLIEPDNLRQDTAFGIEGLIENYALNTVYQRLYGNPKCPDVQMVGLRSSGCGKGADVVDKDINGCPTITNEIMRWDGPYAKSFKGVCRVYAPVQSFKPTVTLKRADAQTIHSWTLGRMETFDLKRADEQTISVKAGLVVPLAWFPLPLMGCAGSDREPWGCRFQFFRTEVIPLGSEEDRGAIGAVARALRLPPAPISARFPAPSG